MSKRSFGLVSLMLASLFIFAACADPQQPTATPVDFNPTPAGGAPATATPSDSTPDTQPTATPSGPDASAGETIFATNCTACHNTNADRLVGPGLAGIGTTAETRVDGQSADEYLRASILDPGAYVVPDFGEISSMPPFPQFSDQDLENVIAYLKTLE